MPKGVRRHVGPVGVLFPSLGCPLPLSPATPRVSELGRASAVSRPTGSFPRFLSDRTLQAWVGGALSRGWKPCGGGRAASAVTALRTQF